MNYLIFDVGGSAIKYAQMNEKAELIEKGNIQTPLDSITSFLDVIESIYCKFKNKIQGISLSMPGRIDSSRGYTFTGGYLKYNDDREMIPLLQKRCPVPIAIENDGKCAALAESWRGSLSNCNNGIVVILGTGIGGGIIINKTLYKGSHYQSGEFSNIITNDMANAGENNFFWWCSGSAYGLCQIVSKVKGISITEINGYKVFELAKQRDKDVLYILDNFCRKLVIQLMNLHYIFDPEKIAIGGGISAQNILFDYIKKHAEHFSNNMPEGFVKPEIVKCKFGNDSNLIGALYCLLMKNGDLKIKTQDICK